jgi:hypothetical protein
LRLSLTHIFDATIESVWKMICDPTWREAMHADLGHREVVLESFETGNFEALIVVKAIVEADVPGFASRVLHPSNRARISESWRRSGDDGSATGRLEMAVDGVPARVSGEVSIQPTGRRCAYEAALDLDVRIPLIGRKLAEWMKGGLDDQLRAQFEFGDRWLAKPDALAGSTLKRS